MDPIVSILKRIANGQRRFVPDNESPEAMRKFQKEIEVLRECERMGLIVGLQVAPPSKGLDSYGLSAVALVNTGLSYKGDQYLAAPPRRDSETRAWVMSHLGKC